MPGPICARCRRPLRLHVKAGLKAKLAAHGDKTLCDQCFWESMQRLPFPRAVKPRPKSGLPPRTYAAPVAETINRVDALSPAEACRAILAETRDLFRRANP